MSEFLAEVIEVKAKKTASLDVTYRVIIQTDDPKVLELAMLPADTMVKVKVEASGS